MNTILRALALFSLLPLAAACGGGSSPRGESADLAMAPDLLPAPPDLAPTPYPVGPYGVEEDKVVADLTAKGFRLSREHTDSTARPYEDIKLSQVRANPACKCLLLSEAAVWCGPCKAEQALIVKNMVSDPSLCAFEVLVDGPRPGVRPTQQDLEGWTQTYEQNFPVVGANVQTYYKLPRPDRLPTNVVIDPRSMKILGIFTGLSQGTIDEAKALCAAH